MIMGNPYFLPGYFGSESDRGEYDIREFSQLFAGCLYPFCYTLFWIFDHCWSFSDV